MRLANKFRHREVLFKADVFQFVFLSLARECSSLTSTFNKQFINILDT